MLIEHLKIKPLIHRFRITNNMKVVVGKIDNLLAYFILNVC